MKRKTARREKERNMWLVCLKAALIASALSLLFVVLFAFLIYKQILGFDSVGFLNTAVKALAALAAGFIAARAADKAAPLWGAFAGAAYMVLTFAVFSLLSRSFGANVGTLADLAMCALAGAAAGIVINLRKSR